MFTLQQKEMIDENWEIMYTVEPSSNPKNYARFARFARRESQNKKSP